MVEIRAAYPKVSLSSLLYKIWVFEEGFLLTPFQEFLKRHPVFPLLVGQLFRGLHNFIYGLGWACCLVRWMVPLFCSQGGCRCCRSSWRGDCRGRFPLVMDAWGGMTRRVAKDMFPVSNGLLGDKPAGPSHRWLGRIAGLSPPPLWPPFLGTACCHYEIVGWHEHDPHSRILPL